MTCIVGLVDKKSVWMGVDSIGSTSYTRMAREDMKLFKYPNIDGVMIAYSTSFRMGQILMYGEDFLDELSVHKGEVNHKYMVTKFIPKVQKAFDDGGTETQKEGIKTGGSFLVAVKDKLFSIENDYQVGVNSIGFAADGCGEEIALGSLFSTIKMEISPKDRVLLALRAASEFSPFVGPPYHIANTKDCKIETISR